MRKARSISTDMRPEYDFSKGVRGKHAKRYAEGTNIVVLGPEVRDVFPDAKSAQRALRALAKLVRAQGK
jgi:hypothetical protein